MAAEPPSPTKQEVSGTDMTLLDYIRKGEIEKPPLCNYSVGASSPKWRNTVGRLPNTATDGTATSQGLEAHLWRTAMYENYGDEWEEKLKSEKETAVQIIAEGTGDGALTPEPRPIRGPVTVAPITTPHVAAASIPRTAPGSPGSGSLQSGSTRSSQLTPRALKNKAF